MKHRKLALALVVLLLLIGPFMQASTSIPIGGEVSLAEQTQSADLVVTSEYESLLCPEREIHYTLTLTNNFPGGSGLKSASIESPIPTGTDYVGDSAVGGAQFVTATQQIEWSGRLDAGESAQISFSIVVDANLPNGSTIVNQATGTVDTSTDQVTVTDTVDCILVPPTLTEAVLNPSFAGQMVQVVGNGGYVEDSLSNQDLTWREFPLHLDGQETGTLACEDGACLGTLIVSTSTMSGTYPISTTGGSTVPLMVLEPPAITASEFEALVPAPFKIYLPGISRNFDPDLPVTILPGEPREVDVTFVRSSGVKTIAVAAAGSGAGARLSSWDLTGGGVTPQHLTDSPVFPGYDVRLYVLDEPTQEIVLSAAIRGDGNLWLTTWHVADDGTFTQLDSNGYGSNAGLDVREYALAHREIRDGSGSLQALQLFTPILIQGNVHRVITWLIDPATGFISGQNDSGQRHLYGVVGSDPTGIEALYLGDGIFTFAYVTTDGLVQSEYWRVWDNGDLLHEGRGVTAEQHNLGTDDLALQPLTDTGLMLSTVSSGAVTPSTWEYYYLSWPGYQAGWMTTEWISDNSKDLEPGDGVTLAAPSITADRAQLVEKLGGGGTDLLWEQYPANNTPPFGPSAGIGSVTKIMATHLALDAVNDGLVSLDDCVPLTGEHFDESSRTGMSAGDSVSLRTLLLASIMVSDPPATQAAAAYVSEAKHGPDSFVTLIQMFRDDMNTEAQNLGMADTIYCGARGACNSTPADQITLWLAAWSNPGFADIVNQRFFTEADKAAEQALCGASIDTWGKYGHGVTFAGRDGWKGGYALKTYGAGYDQANQLACGLPDLSLLAAPCQNCFLGQATRLGRTFVAAHSQSANKYGDAHGIFTHGMQQLFTPDRRGATYAILEDTPDLAIDRVDSLYAVTAIVNDAQELEICSWAADAGLGTIERIGCAQLEVDGLAPNNRPLTPTLVDAVLLSSLNAEGDYLTFYKHASQVELKLWRVAPKP